MSLKHFVNVDMKYTPEMEEWFNKRTKYHIDLVQKYASKIEQLDPKFKGLSKRAEKHDASKYKNIEKIPYIFISWSYHLKDIGKSKSFFYVYIWKLKIQATLI